MRNLLHIKDLRISFNLPEGRLEAVRGVSFRVPAGRTVALVGESGSGKSVVSQAIMGILPRSATVDSGRILLNDPATSSQVIDIASLNPDSQAMRDIRGSRISIIFQEPMTSLSPVHSVGNQICEALHLHRKVSTAEGLSLATEMLRLVGFPDPAKAINTYPFELSGGLRQRAMIAMALVCRPALLIADEPTTALDVTIQAQILKLIKDLQSELGMAVLMITHDLGVVANVADEVVVMYHGEIMESGTLDDIFKAPAHPYLSALLRAVPRFHMKPGERLVPIREIKKRAELGAIAGLVLVTVFFLITANANMFTLAGIMNFMAPAAQLGILAIGAALLMVGGEFDLSVGSMVAFAGLVFGTCLVVLGIPLPGAIVITFIVAGAMGALNGQIVLRTGLPSFIVTLAFLFILRGMTLVGLKWATGGSTQLRGVKEAVEGSWLAGFFSGDALEGLFAWFASMGWVDTFKNGLPKVQGVPVEVIWFVIFAAIATWVLVRTRFGNWIFAAGGDANAARNSGVAVNRVKTILFILTACCAALVAILTVLDAGSTDARRGFQKEFEAIIAAVIGGCLLTGGYGSAIGAAIGAVIFGMVLIGLTYTTIDQDWYLVFLGGMLLTAVLFNNFIRKRATGER